MIEWQGDGGENEPCRLVRETYLQTFAFRLDSCGDVFVTVLSTTEVELSLRETWSGPRALCESCRLGLFPNGIFSLSDAMWNMYLKNKGQIWPKIHKNLFPLTYLLSMRYCLQSTPPLHYLQCPSFLKKRVLQSSAIADWRNLYWSFLSSLQKKTFLMESLKSSYPELLKNKIC